MAFEIIDQNFLRIVTETREATIELKKIDAIILYKEDAVRFVVGGYSIPVSLDCLTEEDKEFLRNSAFKVRV